MVRLLAGDTEFHCQIPRDFQLSTEEHVLLARYSQLCNGGLYVGFLFVYRRLSLKPVDEQDRNLSVLTGYLETVMTSILGSIKECPSYMRAAFRNLARRVSDHFGDEPEYEVELKPLCLTKKKNKTTQWHFRFDKLYSPASPAFLQAWRRREEKQIGPIRITPFLT